MDVKCTRLVHAGDLSWVVGSNLAPGVEARRDEAGTHDTGAVEARCVVERRSSYASSATEGAARAYSCRG
eukprot:CAMPEP_0182479182 /NCGR_PEP_ID=MMETSP1319-20130603/33737_1 /TAXON_ID=172717 /ORGANISM="Bolidomonas pacifica, Strain RCC208" /LENGTH=69 /DNA_ID=CAMNT_0024680597 /DNA_START=105 /DNA_END=310 /DNA_ORIENTATION=+